MRRSRSRSRPRASQLPTARSAGTPNGTVRSLEPLPSTRSTRRCRSTSPRSRPVELGDPDTRSRRATPGSPGRAAPARSRPDPARCPLTRARGVSMAVACSTRSTDGRCLSGFGEASRAPTSTCSRPVRWAQAVNDSGGRGPSSHRRTGRSGGPLPGEPAAQDGQAQPIQVLRRCASAHPAQMVQQCSHIGGIPGNRCRGQPALCGQIHLERVHRAGQRAGQRRPRVGPHRSASGHPPTVRDHADAVKSARRTRANRICRPSLRRRRCLAT